MDTVDNRVKQIDYNGVVSCLSDSGWKDKNNLINGGFTVNQRLAAALTNIPSPSATARVYTADRWTITIGNITTPQFQQVDTIAAPETGLQSRFYARFKQLTNAAKIIIAQTLPATATAPLRGRIVRFSVKMRYSVCAAPPQAMRLGLIQLNSSGTADAMPASFIPAFNANGTDPTLGTNLAYIAPTLADNGTVNGNAIDCSVTSSWQRFSATFLVPSNCVNLIVAVWSNNTLAANDDVLISECGLYDGMEIRDWVEFDPAEELLRCQRYYCKTFPQGTAPAQSGGLPGSVKTPLVIVGAVATSIVGYWKFPVTMRTTPGTITFYNPSAANAYCRNTVTSTDATATSSVDAGDTGLGFLCTGLSGWTTLGSPITVHITADAEL